MGKYRAEIAPLDGKYYGTVVEIYPVDDFEQVGIIKIWFMGDGKPSHRELASYPDPSEWEGDSSHYESADGLDIAVKLMKAINA